MSTFFASVDDFSHAALGWSAAQPAVSPRAIVTASARRPFVAVAQWAVAAVVVLMAGGAVVAHRPGSTVAVSAPGIAVVDDSEAQIAQDNQLLESVNVALVGDDPSPFREYRLRETPQKRMKARAEVRSE